LFSANFSVLSVAVNSLIALVSGNVTSLIMVLTVIPCILCASFARKRVLARKLITVLSVSIVLLSMLLPFIPLSDAKALKYLDRQLESQSGLLNLQVKISNNPLALLSGSGPFGIGTWLLNIDREEMIGLGIEFSDGKALGDRMPRQLHNSFISLLITYGLWGVGAFLFIIAYSINQSKIFVRVVRCNLLRSSAIESFSELETKTKMAGFAIISLLGSSILMYQLSHLLLPIFVGQYFSLIESSRALYFHESVPVGRPHFPGSRSDDTPRSVQPRA
jgi:hypothetical protein